MPEETFMVTLVQVPRYVALLKKYGSKPRITQWLKPDGDLIEKGDVIVAVDTSKASLEVESPAAGFLFILRKVQERVAIGDTLAVVAESKTEFTAFKDCLAGYPVLKPG